MNLFLYFLDYLIPIISPTYLLSDLVKNNPKYFNNEFIRKEKIKKLYYTYFNISIIICFLLLIFPLKQYRFISIIFICFSFSRVVEIFLAFIIDAIDKMKNKPLSKKGLSYYERFILALKSYLELIFDYAIIYFLLDLVNNLFLFDSSSKFFNANFASILQALYLSANTISLLGYGDIYPEHILPELITSLQIISAVFLIIVNFTIYVTLNFSSENNLNIIKRKRKVRNKILTITQIIITLLLITCLYTLPLML